MFVSFMWLEPMMLISQTSKYVNGWVYLPVQRTLVTIKWVHYDEKFTFVLLQERLYVFAVRIKIFNDFHDGHRLRRREVFVSQDPQRSEWKFDDKLDILDRKNNRKAFGNERNTGTVAQLVSAAAGKPNTGESNQLRCVLLQCSGFTQYIRW